MEPVNSSSRIAVVLMNLGGPDSLKAVKPFLYNLFNDPAILQLPAPLRQMLAWIISRARASKAIEIYTKIGGKSPLLENTQRQQQHLQTALNQNLPGSTFQVFISMRYWHPLTEETVRAVKEFQPDQVILVPLYPQYSTTTTRSSLRQWSHWAQSLDLNIPTQTVCCYETHPGFLSAYKSLIAATFAKIPSGLKVRLLFSAHGLPQKIVDAGDPYAWQVTQSVEALMKSFPDQEYQICYQSKVGPLKWLGPSLNNEIHRAADDSIGVVVVPIAFVSDHSETLVELDRDFKILSQSLGIPFYERVPVVDCHPDFIACLANLVKDRIILHTQQTHTTCGAQICCPASFSQCGRIS